MSEELDNIVDNLSKPATWIRIVFMLAYAVVLYLIIAPVIFVLMVAQALFSVFTGRDNRNLRYLGAALSEYVAQILKYISYNSDTRPFPFSDFPAVQEAEPEVKSPPEAKKEPAAEDDTPASKPAAKKSPRKKAASKKAPAAKKSGAKKIVNKQADADTTSDDSGVAKDAS